LPESKSAQALLLQRAAISIDPGNDGDPFESLTQSDCGYSLIANYYLLAGFDDHRSDLVGQRPRIKDCKKMFFAGLQLLGCDQRFQSRG
jgi:hypothetical protein